MAWWTAWAASGRRPALAAELGKMSARTSSLSGSIPGRRGLLERLSRLLGGSEASVQDPGKDCRP